MVPLALCSFLPEGLYCYLRHAVCKGEVEQPPPSSRHPCERVGRRQPGGSSVGPSTALAVAAGAPAVVDPAATILGASTYIQSSAMAAVMEAVAAATAPVAATTLQLAPVAAAACPATSADGPATCTSGSHRSAVQGAPGGLGSLTRQCWGACRERG